MHYYIHGCRAHAIFQQSGHRLLFFFNTQRRGRIRALFWPIGDQHTLLYVAAGALDICSLPDDLPRCWSLPPLHRWTTEEKIPLAWTVYPAWIFQVLFPLLVWRAADLASMIWGWALRTIRFWDAQPAIMASAQASLSATLSPAAVLPTPTMTVDTAAMMSSMVSPLLCLILRFHRVLNVSILLRAMRAAIPFLSLIGKYNMGKPVI